MERMKANPEVSVRMNLSPDIFVGEDRERVKDEIRTAIRLADRRENTFLGTGVLPYNANPELVRFARSFAEAEN